MDILQVAVEETVLFIIYTLLIILFYFIFSHLFTYKWGLDGAHVCGILCILYYGTILFPTYL